MKQQDNFGSYVDRLFLNVFTGNPDSSIKYFVKEFAPFFLDTSTVEGGWTSYPDISIKPKVISHGYFLERHPFIDTEVQQLEFIIYTTTASPQLDSKILGFQDVKLVFQFSEWDSAIRLFNKLRADISKLGIEGNFYENGSTRFSELYSPEILYNIPSGLNIYLQPDIDIRRTFKVTVCINCDS